MIKRKYFSDGSYLEWESKESFRYVENGLVALTWLDFTSGLFSRKRIIKLSSLQNWNQTPTGVNKKIPNLKVIEIIEKIKQFYGKNRIDVEQDQI